MPTPPLDFEYNQENGDGQFDWSDPSNWSGDAQPSDNSSVLIQPGPTAGIAFDDIDSLTLGTLHMISAPLEVGGTTGAELTVGDLELQGTALGETSIESYDGGTLNIDSITGAFPGDEYVVAAVGDGSVTTISGADPGLQYAAETGGTLVFDQTPNSASTLSWTGSADIAFAQTQEVTAHLSGLNVGDSLELPGTSVESLEFGANSLMVSTNEGTAVFTDVSYGALPPTDYTTSFDSSTGLEEITFTACYGRGTHIRTALGDVPIEALKVGDEVVTANGERRAVRWLGSRRIDCRRYANPSVVWPIRIDAGALAPELPQRDLWVSPGHGFHLEGALIQAEKLVNGATIVRVPQARVEYWHVELESHDLVLAEGALSESYLDTGNRTAFDNGGAYLEAYPDFKPKHWQETCVPLVTEGDGLVRARTHVLERAKALGYSITHDSGLHVMADGERVDPVEVGDGRWAFWIPATRQHIDLCSRSFIPAGVDPSSRDERELGVCVGRLQVNGDEVPLGEDAPYTQGWHALEPGPDGRLQRWSCGRAALPADARVVIVDIVEQSLCWERPEPALARATRLPNPSVSSKPRRRSGARGRA